MPTTRWSTSTRRTEGRIYLSGVQALVRLPLMQKLRDAARRAEHRRLHQRLSRLAAGRLRPGAVAGQEAPRSGEGEVPAGPQRGPGRDHGLGHPADQPVPRRDRRWRVRHVVRQGSRAWTAAATCSSTRNAAGTSRNGGVLALAADDHNCRSSTLPHGSEHEFVSAMMPVLNPAGVQDILDMGLLGWAMSRFTGRWVGFKTIAETVESSASVDVDPFAMQIVLPRCRFRDARRRPQHPLAGSAAGPGDAPASLRGQGRAGVRAGERHRPHRDRLGERAARHRHHRQELPRRAAGAGIPRA
jgi:indolepyruvate ferredoxin oxidoreductase